MFHLTFRYRQFFFLLLATFFFLSHGQLWASNIHRLQPTNTTPTVQPTNITSTITFQQDLLLIPHSLKLSKQQVTSGEVISLHATVHNPGSQILNRVRVRFSCGREKKDIFVNLRPNQRLQVQGKLAIPGPAGTKTVQVELNPLHNELSETNYRNNKDTARIIVSTKAVRASQPSSSAFPVITRVQPNTVKSGKDYSLKLFGKHIKKGINLDFGRGIKVLGEPATFDGYIMVPVRVDTGATSGRRKISISYQGKKKEQRPTLNVQAGEKLTIRQISPSTLLQGKEYFLNIHGKGFSKALSIHLGQDITALGELRVISSEKVRLRVMVNSSARLGEHTVTLQGGSPTQNPSMRLGGSSRKAVGTVSVTKSSQPVNIDPLVPPPLILLPQLTSITPAHWNPGGKYKVTVQGSQLDQVKMLFFGGDIQVQQVELQKNNSLSFSVSIDETAKAGDRPLLVIHKGGQLNSGLKAWIVDQPGQMLAIGQNENIATTFSPQPRITSVTPSRWIQGQEHTVTVLGTMLDQVEMLSFGSGLTVSKLQHHGDTKMSFVIKVHEASNTGPRTAIISHAGSQQSSGAKAWIVKKVVELISPPALAWKPGLIEIQQAAIYLKDPSWKYGGDVSSMKPLPVLNDKTLFTWREQITGLADIFEIRFLTPQGKFIDSHIIDMGEPKVYTTAFKPTKQFITELLQKHQSALIKGSLVQNPLPKIGDLQVVAPMGLLDKSAGSSTATNGLHYTFEEPIFSPVPVDKGQLHQMTPMEEYIRDKGDAVDLLWQVIGYKQVVRNGNIILQSGTVSDSKKTVKKAGSTELIEIEISEQWPLGLPGSWPTGVTCDAANQLEMVASGSHNNGADPSDGNHYPGDTIKVEGTFSIKNSPWSISANTTYKGGETIEDDSYSFNNIIIDWGDGIHWQRLEAKAAGSSAGGVNSNLPGWVSTDLMKTSASHQYTAPGDYQVRLYVVPDDEMGQIESIVAVHGYRPPTGVADAGSKPAKQPLSATQLTMNADVSSDLRQQSMLEKNKLSMPGSNIFMLYCDPLPITIIQDTAATGPLHLDSVEISSFSSDFKAANGTQLTGNTGMNSLTLQEQSTATSLTAISAPSAIISSKYDSTVSTCAGGLWATGKLKYFGQGYANIQWFVDDIVVDSKQIKVGPSKLRKDFQSANSASQGEPNYSSITIRSPRLPVQETGGYTILVRATVAEDSTLSMVNSVALQSSVGDLSRSKPSGKKSSRATVPLISSDFQPSFLPVGSSKDVLQPSQATNTTNMYASLKNKFKQNSSSSYLVANPPFSVISKTKQYLVQESNGNAPCRFLFATQEGPFEINDLQSLQMQGTRYSGNGLLLLTMADGPHSNGEQPVRIPFQNWQIDDAFTVQQGVLKADLQESLDELPGMQATLTGLQGNAGEHVNAVLDVTLKDATIRLLGVEVPQKWTNVSSILTPEGDWYADGLPLGKSLIGWSMTSIESNDVRLDLSRNRGEAVSCGYGGDYWVGVHLGIATLYPYLFDMAEIPIIVNDWGLTADGLCGRAEIPGFNTAFGDGSIGWDNLTINVYKSSLNAQYKNFFVEMAWPKVRLQSNDAGYSYTPGSDVSIQLGLNNLPVIEEHYDHIDMKLFPESFSRKDETWGLQADAELTFRDEQQAVFAPNVPINDLFFTIDSEALYGGSSIGLNIQSQLGGADEVISTMDLTTGGAEAKRKLSMDFTTEFSIEGIGKAAHPVHILYGVNKEQGGDAYSTTPVHPSEITLRSEFPVGDPITVNEFKINYQGNSGQIASTNNTLMYAANFGYGSVLSDAWPNTPLLATTGSVSGGTCGNDTFGGTVDTQMFAGNGKTIVGTFRFGEQDDSKYWLTYFKMDNMHQHIYAGVFLEMIQGGLAYNFSHDALSQDNGFAACPAPGKGILFSSGLGLSFTSTDVVRADGVLTIHPKESFYQYEVDVTLFDTANLSGRLRYHDSAFAGELWGNVSLYENQVYLEVPENGSGIYVDSGSWLFAMGTEARPVTGHVLSVNAGVFMSLGSEDGFKAGGSYTQKLGDKFCCWSGFGVRGHADLVAAVDLTFNPAQINGTLSGSVHGSFVNPVKDLGLGINVNGWIGCCDPVKLGFGLYKKCCCVKAGGDLTILPSPDFGAWAEWYCGKFW